MTNVTQHEPAIGQIVKSSVNQVLQHCEVVDHGELERLLDRNYSHQVFGLAFPFCKIAAEIEPGTGEHARYWTQVFTVRGRQVRVTSQWFEKNRNGFLTYLTDIGVVTSVLDSDNTVEDRAPRQGRSVPSQGRSVPSGRYKSHAIGNAQNSFIRNLLGALGEEAFSMKDWVDTKAHFDDRCAYCGSLDDLVMDHAVPINRASLGEHRLGNLVPACHGCNSAKGNKDFRAFEGANVEAVSKIEAFMDSRDYVPLGDNAQIRLFLETAYAEVGSLADRYITLINSFFPATGPLADEVDRDADSTVNLA
jgi:5-methylcytosine-specific restriction endonuclease McrA